MSDDKSINGLTERELLILVNERLTRLEKEITEFTVMSTKLQELELKLAQIDTKVKVWATIIGFIAGFAASIFLTFFK